MQADEKGSRCESGATAITVFGRNGNRRLGRQPLSGLLEKAFLLRPRVGAKSQETCHRDRQSTSGQTGSCSANRPSASSAKQVSGLRGRMAGLCTGSSCVVCGRIFVFRHQGTVVRQRPGAAVSVASRITICAGRESGSPSPSSLPGGRSRPFPDEKGGAALPRETGVHLQKNKGYGNDPCSLST